MQRQGYALLAQHRHHWAAAHAAQNHHRECLNAIKAYSVMLGRSCSSHSMLLWCAHVRPPLWTITAAAFLSGRLAERTGKTMGAPCIAPAAMR